MPRPTLRTSFRIAVGVLLAAAIVLVCKFGLRSAPMNAETADPLDAALDRRIAEVWMVDVPFDEAIKRVAELGQVPISLSMTGQPQAGLPVVRVTILARDIKFGDLLEAVLKAARDRSSNAVWGIEAGKFVVTVAPESVPVTSPVCVRAYAVGDVVRESLFRPGITFDDPNPAAGLAVNQEHLLVQFLMASVDPDSWRGAGGFGSARLFGDRMVAAQTAAGHWRIRTLLAKLRYHRPSGQQSSRWFDDQSLRWDTTLQRWVSNSSIAAEVKLDALLREFRVEDKPLRHCIEKLAAEAGLIVTFDPGIPKLTLERSVTIAIKNAAAYEALSALLDLRRLGPAEKPNDEFRLVWRLNGEVLTIEPASEERLDICTHVYDIRSWLRAASASGDADYREVAQDAAVDRLLNTLTAEVDPDTWRNAGGSVGAAREHGGYLIVTQTWANQAEVRKVIRRMVSGGK